MRLLGERALAIRERAFGPDHPLVASALKLLVHAAFQVGDTREARRLAERALAIRRARLGPNHPDVAASLYTLASIEYLAGDSLAVVRDPMDQSLRGLERSLGPEEIELRHPLHGLLAVALDQGDYPAALAYARRALHLATHGFFLGAACATREKVATMGTDADLSVTQMAATENPLLVSGLALAGFNRRREAPPGGDDGVLTAEEVAMLDLGGVDWVVLSACDTGVGVLGTGEGVLGLRRAFQIAGAHTIIMSLWKIQDEATRHFMQSLYRARWVRGLPTDTALREASLEMLHEHRKRGESTHPATWGAFIAAGDWR